MLNLPALQRFLTHLSIIENVQSNAVIDIFTQIEQLSRRVRDGFPCHLARVAGASKPGYF